jgi:hypothetical protein
MKTTFALLLATACLRSQDQVQSWIEPAGMQKSNVPMKILLKGRPGTRVTMRVLQSCGGNGRPDVSSAGPCKSPLRVWHTDLHAELDESLFSFAQYPELPRRKDLWMEVFADNTDGPHSMLHFAIDSEDCAYWKSLVAILGRKACAGGSLEPLLRTFGGDAPPLLEGLTVHLANPDGSEVEPLSDTLNSTGVAWRDADSLWITRGPATGADARLPNPPPAGLYRVDLATGNSILEWEPEAGIPVSPMNLPKNEVALSIQAPPGGTAEFLILDAERNPRFRLPLPFNLYRLIAHRDDVVWGVALSSAGPRLVEVDLTARRAVDWSWNESAYRAAMTSEQGIAVFERAQNGRWILVREHQGQISPLFSTSATPNVLAVWRNDGGRIAFLKGDERWNQGRKH